MKNDKQIVMKKVVNFSNPAKSELLESDEVLTNYVREITNYPSMTAKEEKIIAKKAKEGDLSSKQKLIQSNLRLVITIAKKAIHNSNLPMTDLIQEGNLGLMIAAEKFNYKLGYKFATYASWWIKQSMFKAISEQSHCMKIPVYIQETLSKFSKIKNELEKNGNDKIKTEDIADKMNISADKINLFLSAYSKPISIEGGLEKEDGKELNVEDILVDEKSVVSENAEYENLINDMNSVISTLKEREQDVIKMRYGIGDTTRCTLEEIGNLYGVTKECIRQTELRALKKLKMSGENILMNYLY